MSYYGEKMPYKEEKALVMSSLGGRQLSPDLLLGQKAEQLCRSEGMDYKKLEPIQRLFLTHYRCPTCKLVPLYHLNLKHPKRVRCSKCGNLVSFNNSGKYGRLRKKIALALWFASEGA